MLTLFKLIIIRLAQVIGVVILIFLAYLGWSRWELNRLEALCTEIHPGDKVTSLDGIVEKYGFDKKWVEYNPLGGSDGNGQVLFIPAISTFGEITCTIRYTDETVLSAMIK